MSNIIPDFTEFKTSLTKIMHVVHFNIANKEKNSLSFKNSNLEDNMIQFRKQDFKMYSYFSMKYNTPAGYNL